MGPLALDDSHTINSADESQSATGGPQSPATMLKKMRTLADVFPLMRALGKREAMRHHNGYRTRRLSYRDLLQHIGGFAEYLDQQGFRKGDRLILWGENRPEWAVVFWACVARGVEVVPIDFRSSPQLIGRVQADVAARLLVTGAEVDPAGLAIEQLPLDAVNDRPLVDHFDTAPLTDDDVVEIVFTSGTTGEPKGVVHRHKNVCANLTPIHREIKRYLWLARPFQPIRLLDLLPLSHMFGQSAGLSIPVLLGGAAVFTTEMHPPALFETIRCNRVSAVIAVPRMLRNLQREVERRFGAEHRHARATGILGAAERWWIHRDVHRLFGWKFWSLVVGGAPLDPEWEDFWRELGFVVVQGYGLTEASPVVALNHPFSTRRGSLGQAIAGQQIKLAPDGEILVRGDSVVSDYVGGGSSDTRVEAGWLHTGDIGELDAQGRLYYKGRKKDVIINAEGLNIYPQDIEAVLNKLPQVKDSVVIARHENGDERIHAVLILAEPSADLEVLIRAANRRLESHQRIRSWSVWTDEDFPRTPSTLKVKRAEVARRLATRNGPDSQPETSVPAHKGTGDLLAEVAGTRLGSLRPDLRLTEDLGLSSLERVELMTRLEQELGIEIDEEAFSAISTVEELSHLQQHPKPAEPVPSSAQHESSYAAGAPAARPAFSQQATKPPSERLLLPRWAHRWPVRLLRRLTLNLALLPAFRQLVRVRAHGLENLDGLSPPVLFAANHASHFDTALVLAALPGHWRNRVTPAMSQDYFRPFLDPRGIPWRERLKFALQYYLACGLFHAYPLPQQTAGTRRSLKYTGELIDAGFCPLVYPEGARTTTGVMQPFKQGIGLMAVRLGVPVVPVHLTGTFEIYSEHDDWPRPGEAVLRVGLPLHFSHDTEYGQATEQIEDTVRLLAPHEGE